MQGSRRARAPPIYPCLPVEGKGEGCPVGPNLRGRVRARVRVRARPRARARARAAVAAAEADTSTEGRMLVSKK